MYDRTSTPEREIAPYSFKGCFRNQIPFVTGGIFLPGRPKNGGIVNFMLDLSSDISLLAPFDAQRLGCTMDHTPLQKAIGWKGSINLGFDSAELVFNGFAFHNVTLGIVASEPIPHSPMPSILGWDVLRLCRIVMEPRRGLLEIVPKAPNLDDAKANVDANAVWFEYLIRDESSDRSWSLRRP